jgi:hypothetical protein
LPQIIIISWRFAELLKDVRDNVRLRKLVSHKIKTMLVLEDLIEINASPEMEIWDVVDYVE